LTLLGPHLYNFWVPETRRNNVSTLLEIAPSDATSAFRGMFTRAVTVDADPQADGRAVDLIASLTDLPLAPNSFDAVMVLHVLEHIVEDRKAMREIARVLRPNALGILQVPISANPETDEEELHSPEERLARYGQVDHVRLYGMDYFTRLRDEGLSVLSIAPKDCLPPEIIGKYALSPCQALDFVVRANSKRATGLLDAFGKSLRKGAI
jgi:SAM-dependent methyltransferase